MCSSRYAVFSLRLAAAAVAVAAALGSPSARALTAEEILNYQGPDRQKVLEDGARKEGTVFLYSGMIVNQLLRPLTEAFEKRYPFVRTRYWRGDSNQVLVKVLSEMQANALEADLVEGSGIGAVAGTKTVLPFSSPLFEALPKEDIAPDRTWAATRFRYIGLGYNTNYVSRD
jgi:iron(III) transport system substrate-binding protein